MKQLYAPWRGDYTSSTVRGKKEDTPEEDCIFCSQFKEQMDEKNFILKRFEHNVVMLCRYPYNAGHLLILPLTHVAGLQEISKEARGELMELANRSIEILNKTINPDGCNVGLNLGKAAGAGIPSHLHMHVLPRWTGDTNFMPVIAGTKVISFNIDEIYKKLHVAFAEL
jgi:ATP adenylyltransferase